jgi:hypothetical protein
MHLLLLLLSPLPVFPFFSQVEDKNAHQGVHFSNNQPQGISSRRLPEERMSGIFSPSLITGNTVLNFRAPLEKFIRQGREFLADFICFEVSWSTVIHVFIRCLQLGLKGQ